MCSSLSCPRMGVSTTAGAMQFTSTPEPATSFAIDFVIPITAALLAEYAAAIGLPSLPAIDATLTTRPYPSRAGSLPGTRTCPTRRAQPRPEHKPDDDPLPVVANPHMTAFPA